MTVKELIEKLTGCDPSATVVFHELLDLDGVTSYEFAPVRFVQSGFAMNTYMEGGDNEITVYVDKGKHSQGYEISHPVVALSESKLERCKTNATTDFWSGRDEQRIADLETKRR